MNYPNHKEKHGKEAFFTPEDYLKYAKAKFKEVPKKIIIVYYEYLANHFKDKYDTKSIKFGGRQNIYVHKDIGVILMSGIGSPHVTTALEEMIALGAKEILNIGSAGELVSEGTFLCTKAIRDEGVSHHYLAHELFSYPDEHLTKKLDKSMKKNKINFEKGATWTIDAPYRETKDEIKHYRDLGVKTVEMEASAIFSVAKYRGVKAASAFHVSDLLVDNYTPMFEKEHMQNSLKKLLDSAINVFLEND